MHTNKIFNSKEHMLVGIPGCPALAEAEKKFKTRANKSYQWQFWKNLGCKTSPSIVERKPPHKILATGSDVWRKWTLQKSNFGSEPRSWKTSLSLGSGTYRAPGAKDYIPQLGNWGRYSASASRRGGNAVKCNDWLFKDRSAPHFPMKKKSLVMMAYGKPLTRVLSEKKYYNHRGNNGFEKVPKSIYMKDGGPVFDRSYSPYTGARVSGLLPRPYGPRDNAALKGYPNAALKGYSNVNFGENYGPFVNQSYFGKQFVDAKPQFRPNFKLSRKPNYNSYANSNLYVKGWNPYQIQQKRTPKQKQFAKASRAISRKNAIQARMNYGLTGGPNLVGYENPMLLYSGAGANTVNYLTGSNYYKPCRSMKQYPYLKVKKNNNPTGFLSKSSVKPIKGLNFGSWSNSHVPWISRGAELGRPFSTQFMNLGDGGGSGVVRIGQPLDLYTYMNSPYGGYQYPEFLGPRSWMGGFGTRKKSKKSSARKSSARKSSAQKSSKQKSSKQKSSARKKYSDTIHISNGKVKVIKSK